LWLLAGDPGHAKAAFELAAAKASTDAGRFQAQAGVARSMRAADGTVARANAYLRKCLAEHAKQSS
jgi:hypothetical protein